MSFPSPGQDGGRTLLHLLLLIWAPSTVQGLHEETTEGCQVGIPYKSSDSTRVLYRESFASSTRHHTHRATNRTSLVRFACHSLSSWGHFVATNIYILPLHSQSSELKAEGDKDENPDSLPSKNLQPRGKQET